MSTENLQSWDRLARRQLGQFYGYEVMTILDETDIRQLYAIDENIQRAPGLMAGDTDPDVSRRVAMVGNVPSPERDWFTDILFERVLQANAQLWQRNDLSPAPNLLWNRYYEDREGFITWHTDTAVGDPRTITCVVLLKHAKEGGGFQLNGVGDITLDPGQGVIFPAHIFHRVPPVTKGYRDSLTLWIHSDRNMMP